LSAIRTFNVEAGMPKLEEVRRLVAAAKSIKKSVAGRLLRVAPSART